MYIEVGQVGMDEIQLGTGKGDRTATYIGMGGLVYVCIYICGWR